jgi:hypothetical protein
MSQDQSAKHFECCNLPGWVTILVSPVVVVKGHLVVEPLGLLLRGVLTVSYPTHNARPFHRVRTSVNSSPPVGCRIIGTGLDLGMM